MCLPKCIHLVSATLILHSTDFTFLSSALLPLFWYCRIRDWWNLRSSLSVQHIEQSGKITFILALSQCLSPFFFLIHSPCFSLLLLLSPSRILSLAIYLQVRQFTVFVLSLRISPNLHPCPILSPYFWYAVAFEHISEGESLGRQVLSLQ